VKTSSSIDDNKKLINHIHTIFNQIQRNQMKTSDNQHQRANSFAKVSCNGIGRQTYRFTIFLLKLFLFCFLRCLTFVHSRHRFHLFERGQRNGNIGENTKKHEAGKMNKSTAQRKGGRLKQNSPSAHRKFLRHLFSFHTTADLLPVHRNLLRSSHLRNVVHEHVFHAGLESHRARGTAAATAGQLHPHFPHTLVP